MGSTHGMGLVIMLRNIIMGSIRMISIMG